MPFELSGVGSYSLSSLRMLFSPLALSFHVGRYWAERLAFISMQFRSSPFPLPPEKRAFHMLCYVMDIRKGFT